MEWEKIEMLHICMCFSSWCLLLWFFESILLHFINWVCNIRDWLVHYVFTKNNISRQFLGNLFDVFILIRVIRNWVSTRSRIVHVELYFTVIHALYKQALGKDRPWTVQPAWWLRYVATKQKRKHEGKSRERKKLEPVVRCVWVHLAVVVLRAFLIRFYNHTPLLLPLWHCLLQSYFMHVSLKCSFYSRPMCHANGPPTEWLKQPQQEEKDRKSNKNEHRLLHTNMATCFQRDIWWKFETPVARLTL